MNDDIREKLSAYLDGALSDADRRAVEVELSRSEDLTRELEALRSVSNAVKGLPKEKLPDGFLARLESRRAREEGKPARDYYILPPTYRPLAFALSTAVVALVVWDKTRTPEELYAPRPGWDSEKVAVRSAAEAPASVDISGQIAAMDQKAAAPAQPEAAEAFNRVGKKESVGAMKLAGSSTFGKHISAPGQPLGFSEPVASAPAPAALDAMDGLQGNGAGSGGSTIARNEEERSAINERLYKGFEEEKKRMGIARIMDKDVEDKNLPTGGREMMTLQATPDAARLDDASPAAKAPLRAKAKAAKRAAAPVKAIALKSADALQAAWAAAGLAGDPPSVEFPGQMAVFLAGPAGSGIVEVQERKRFLVVLYKDSGFSDPSARVKALAASVKPVVVKLAP